MILDFITEVQVDVYSLILKLPVALSFYAGWKKHGYGVFTGLYVDVYISWNESQKSHFLSIQDQSRRFKPLVM